MPFMLYGLKPVKKLFIFIPGLKAKAIYGFPSDLLALNFMLSLHCMHCPALKGGK